MKKLLSFSLILILLYLFVNLSYADTTYKYDVNFDKIQPIDMISDQPDYEINVTLDNEIINVGESIITLNPYLIIDMNYYIDDTLVYTAHKELLIYRKHNIIFVKVDRVNELGQYPNLYYWFYFSITKTEITPTPIITNSPTPIKITDNRPTNTGNILPTISPEQIIVSSNSPKNFKSSNIKNVLSNNKNKPSNNKNESSKIIANNKSLPQTGEEKPLFMLVGGGFIMLLGTIFLVSKIKKKL
jgi:LPXTG-motif cell wall-anchored protein